MGASLGTINELIGSESSLGISRGVNPSSGRPIGICLHGPHQRALIVLCQGPLERPDSLNPKAHITSMRLIWREYGDRIVRSNAGCVPGRHICALSVSEDLTLASPAFTVHPVQKYRKSVSF